MVAWSASRRVGFRFLFVYLLFYLAPFPLDALPFGLGERLEKASRVPWYSVVPWVGNHVLRLSHPIFVIHHGKADSMFGWVWSFSEIALALVITLTWSVLDRSKAHEGLARALHVYVRYYVAWTLLSYGMYKVFNSQFPFPSPEKLMRQYGDSTPSALLWTFMGYSPTYSAFGGAAECFGGVLLFWRRTALLGALVSFAVVANVVMLNLCYDVPLKLYSMHLLAMTIGLAAPDAKRCANMFLFNRATRPKPPFRLPRQWMQQARLIVKPIVVFALVAQDTYEGWDAWRNWGNVAPEPWNYGLYEVETFVRGGVVVEPLPTNVSRWQRLAFNKNGGGAVERMDRQIDGFSLAENTTGKTMTLRLPDEAVVLAYQRQDADHLVLDGKLDGEIAHIELRRTELATMPLIKQRFRWVNVWGMY